MTNLTSLEAQAITIIAKDGMMEIGASEPIELLNDNFTWFSVKDLTRAMKINAQQAGGVMTSLMEKGLTAGDKSGFALTEAGIEAAQAIKD